MQRQYWHFRVFGAIFFGFAVVALLISVVGLYAVVAQATSQRMREIGVRIALGPTARQIMRLVLARGLAQL